MVIGYRTSIRNKHAPSDWPEKRCDHCGKRFLGRRESLSYCSEPCARDARNERRRAARRQQREPRTRKCVVCGASFKHQRKTRRYCSARCRIAAYREKAIKSNRV
jgi:endogenous inhibitor of DNA gyrase (YacG/DUF329 family)